MPTFAADIDEHSSAMLMMCNNTHQSSLMSLSKQFGTRNTTVTDPTNLALKHRLQHSTGAAKGGHYYENHNRKAVTDISYK